MQIYSDRYFSDPEQIVEIFEPDSLHGGLDRIEKLQQEGYHLLGYMRYDLQKPHPSGMPLLYFEAYRKETDKSDAESRIAEKIADDEFPAGIFTVPLITREEYENKISYIREQILNGVTYEVNYTYPSVLKTSLSDDALYRYLLQKQKTPYNAFIRNRHETVMSFSPELFFSISGRHITTRPMKGTIKRGASPEEDMANREFLAKDVKNRAENIMIADLIRNDLGMIAEVGTVRADRLFAIEEHPTLFQMTSEISAELREGITLHNIIRALHPCGSITGAPKISTMKVIAEAEPYSRDVYCGAIAYLHGDEAIFSVPIRILQKQRGEKYFRYFAGGAVTYDSTAAGEWNETLTKTEFLQTDFRLIETGTGDSGLHMARMKKSAEELGFKWNRELDGFVFPENTVSRIELARDGNFRVTTRNIPAPADRPQVRIRGRVNSLNPFLYHKTTVRNPSPSGIFEEIRMNEKNEITEGTFTNIAVKKDGRMYTPPVSCGLLAGVMRHKLIENGTLTEKILYREDLINADAVYCMNSVRGIFEVELCC